MKFYQRILAYAGLMATVGLGIVGCNRQNKPVEPRYVSGIVKSEKYQNNIIDPDEYLFTLSTGDGLKLFECSGDRSAPKMDSLLDPEDAVKFKLSEYQRDRKNDFSVDLDNIVELNGEPFSY